MTLPALPFGVVRVAGGPPLPALRDGDDALLTVSYTHLTLPTTPYV